ncbi:CheB methylesterase [Calothrix sp. NIES-4071]|nr:CheB methylesterase [Calothrix sp. NIES-4071]BAZ58553.1 CheB methylesterase [Calothrix sp. NIES-4105]
MPNHDIIVVGASAGGVEALTFLVSNLPSDLNASIIIILHVPSEGKSVLPTILNRAKRLPAHHAKDGEVLKPGQIYVAPPGYHLLIKSGYVNLARGPKENNHRPAIDPTFRTAARFYDGRVIGVVLTGVLDDGTAGLAAVKIRGGLAVVQDPSDAMFNGMPRSAIENVSDIDCVLPLSEIPSKLVNLVNTPVVKKNNKQVPELMEYESDIAQLSAERLHSKNKPGKPSEYVCPDCGGGLWELQEDGIFRFRCRTGHAYSPESLLFKQSESLEDALWIAIRALEEKASLADRMAKRMRERNQNLSAQRLEQEAKDAEGRAEIIRNVIIQHAGTEEDNLNSEPQLFVTQEAVNNE